jgi:integrase/recombinase XerD
MIARIPKLSAIKITAPPTLPLSEKQYQDLLAAVLDEFSGAKAKRVRALIELIRHSGLAIRDAVTMETELKWDRKADLHRIVTNRQKTGTRSR